MEDLGRPHMPLTTCEDAPLPDLPPFFPLLSPSLFTISSSGRSSPFSICSRAISPSSVSAWISARSRLPVGGREKQGKEVIERRGYSVMRLESSYFTTNKSNRRGGGEHVRQ